MLCVQTVIKSFFFSRLLLHLLLLSFSFYLDQSRKWKSSCGYAITRWYWSYHCNKDRIWFYVINSSLLEGYFLSIRSGSGLSFGGLVVYYHNLRRFFFFFPFSLAVAFIIFSKNKKKKNKENQIRRASVSKGKEKKNDLCPKWRSEKIRKISRDDLFLPL